MKCDAGKYSTNPGAMSCVDCVPGETSKIGATSSLDCFVPSNVVDSLYATEASGGLVTFSEHAGGFETIQTNLTTTRALAFVSPTSLLLSSTETNEVIESKHTGEKGERPHISHAVWDQLTPSRFA